MQKPNDNALLFIRDDMSRVPFLNREDHKASVVGPLASNCFVVFVVSAFQDLWPPVRCWSNAGPGKKGSRLLGALALAAALSSGAPCLAQVAPAEIRNPELKAAEQAYLPQMTAVNRAVTALEFPFKFAPGRYAGLDPKEQAGADTRGLEFVRFHGRLVLKLTGNYNAAYNAELLTPNQRADSVFDHVVAPILGLLPQYFSRGDSFNAFGFEIAYHVRTRAHGFDYEGKEILVLVFDKTDALPFPDSEPKQQEVLNRSEIYLDGKPFGLALSARDPFEVETLVRSLRGRQSAQAPAEVSEQPAGSGTNAQSPMVRPAILHNPPDQVPAPVPASGAMPPEKPSAEASAPAGPGPDALQKRYQPQLDDLARDGVAKHHFVDYSPPSFVLVRNQISLQLTMRNPNGYDQAATSIYRRAAQSFDLFLAPQLKPILDKVSAIPELGGLDVTVINQLTAKTGSSSEAVEYVFPLQALRRFVDAEITNQDLVNQSLVLVNGVRIALNLQLVE